MSNVHEPTREELQAMAHGIADGLGIIDIAADIGIDRSTLSGWLKRDGFLVQVAKSLDTPADFGSERLENLLDERRKAWERKSSYLLRLDFADAVREGVDLSSMPAYLIGMAVAMVSGILAISLLRFIANKSKFGGFAYYCWVVGVLTIILTMIF